MPRGHYDRKKRKGNASASSTQSVQKEDVKHLPMVLQADYIHECCQHFVTALIDGGVMERSDLFITLSDEAMAKGYTLEARQQGIRGTFISFRKNL